jgi:hypothetical protein
MTTPICANCGTPTRPPYRPPAPESAPDLDLRPGEPARTTLRSWIITCPGCGACAPDLASLPPAAATVLASQAYKLPEGPEEAYPFLRWAMICEAAGDADESGEALLQAAWAADDAADAASAGLRRRAAALWRGATDEKTALRLVDVLRCAGEFEQAAEQARRVAALELDETAEAILAFQRDRIAAHDMGRHMVSSALRPPARMPHVAHGKAARASGGGFWKRLFGG